MNKSLKFGLIACIIFRQLKRCIYGGNYLNSNHQAHNKSNCENNTLKNRGIIVGFDPGLTAGIAILDLAGNILSVKSSKEITRAEIINHIMSYGKAIIISTDVNPPPKMVKRIATSLNARTDYPSKDMPVDAKIELVESFLSEDPFNRPKDSKISPKDAHQRDALAASIRTYKYYHKKLKQIDSRAKEAELTYEQADQIKKMFLSGKAISSAIKTVQELDKEKEEDLTEDMEIPPGEGKGIPQDTGIRSTRLKKRIKNQENQIKNLKNKNESLKEELYTTELENKRLRDKIDRLHYDYTQNILQKKEILSKISLIRKLQDKYNKEKKLREELENNLNSLENIKHQNPSHNSLPVKIIESFTREGILKACEYWKINNGDVVLLKNSEGGGSQTAKLLIKMGVKAVVIRDKISHQAQQEFEKELVPLLEAENMELSMIDQFALINALNLEKEILLWKDEIENKNIQESNEEILKVFDEYRARRKRSVD